MYATMAVVLGGQLTIPSREILYVSCPGASRVGRMTGNGARHGAEMVDDGACAARSRDR